MLCLFCCFILGYQKHITVIIPCYNEQDSIALLLQEIARIMPSINDLLTVVVINDSSTDNSAQALNNCANITLLNLPINLGIGGAVQTGFKYALTKSFDYLIQLDGDGQHPPSEICKLLTTQQATNANVVIGSRFIEKKGFQSTTLRRAGIRYLQVIYFLLTKRKAKDITSGFRLYDFKTVSLIVDRYPDEFPEPDSLVLFSKLRLKVVETPVLMQERQGGKSSIRNLKQLYYITKVSISMLFTALKQI